MIDARGNIPGLFTTPSNLESLPVFRTLKSKKPPKRRAQIQTNIEAIICLA